MERPVVIKDFKIKGRQDLPCGTYGPAFHLTETLEGWRNKRPVINEATCIHCNRCYMVCPEGSIYKEGTHIKIDYRFCKGCGICAKECKRNSITLEEES